MTALEAIRVILAADDARQAALSIREQLKANKKRSRSARKAKAKSLSLPGKTKAKRKKAERFATAAVRRACDERAKGCCEACGAGWMPSTLELDHFWGRAREESVESCWMLCHDCHVAKTENKPSRITWIGEFSQHCWEHNYREQVQKCGTAIAFEMAQHPERRSTEP